MPHRVCPWWLGYFLASPLRRWFDDSVETVTSYARDRMTVLEPGPGMGFYTLELARRVGPSGRVIAVDIQPRMLASLRRRAQRAGLDGRIETRLATPESFAIDDLAGKVDFTLAAAMVHELAEPADFFAAVWEALKVGGRMLVVEPKGHVTETGFVAELNLATLAGLRLDERPVFKRNHAALLTKA